MTYFHHATIVAAVVAGATTASAQTTIITREPVEFADRGHHRAFGTHAGSAAHNLSYDCTRARCAG